MISEKKSCRPISRGKKYANKSLMKYNAENKNLIPLYVGEKIVPIQTKSVKSPIFFFGLRVHYFNLIAFTISIETEASLLALAKSKY